MKMVNSLKVLSILQSLDQRLLPKVETIFMFQVFSLFLVYYLLLLLVYNETILLPY
jgi:hypothetical protein